MVLKSSFHKVSQILIWQSLSWKGETVVVSVFAVQIKNLVSNGICPTQFLVSSHQNRFNQRNVGVLLCADVHNPFLCRFIQWY